MVNEQPENDDHFGVLNDPALENKIQKKAALFILALSN